MAAEQSDECSPPPPLRRVNIMGRHLAGATRKNTAGCEDKSSCLINGARQRLHCAIQCPAVVLGCLPASKLAPTRSAGSAISVRAGSRIAVLTATRVVPKGCAFSSSAAWRATRAVGLETRLPADKPVAEASQSHKEDLRRCAAEVGKNELRRSSVWH